MTDDLRFSELGHEQWDALVDTSPQSSPFNRHDFLEALGTQARYFGVSDGTGVLAGVAVQIGDDGCAIGPPDTFGYYQGILLASQFSRLPEHSRCRAEVETTATLLAGLASIQSDVWLGFHPAFRDLRAVQWFNYHQPQAGQFSTTLRYTGIVDLGAFADVDAYVASLGKGRVADFRKAKTSGIEVRPSDDIDILDRLHRQTFEAQGADRGCLDHQLRPMARAALRQGFGELLVAWAPGGEPVSASLFVWDRAASHYLFGANDPAFRQTGAATLLMIENISRAMQRGMRFIDMVGINSPQRGNFKTSFNARPVPYFEAVWHRSR